MMTKHTWSELGETQHRCCSERPHNMGCKNFGRVLNPDDCGPEFEQNPRELASSNYRTREVRNEYFDVLNVLRQN